MDIGIEHANAQLAASIAFADAAAGASAIALYATPQPATGAAPGGAALAVITLAKPCATLAEGVLSLHPADPTGSMVIAGATPRWARWARSDGVLVADGSVTDEAGGGDFTVSGGSTPPGDNSPALVAGGLVRLGAVTLA